MDIKNVVVAGGGVLGSQIAFQSAYKGFNVKVWLRMESSIGRAKPKFDRVQKIYLATLEAMKTNPAAYCRGLAESPEVTPEQIDELIAKAASAMDRIEFTLSHEEAAKDADLVIEAIGMIPLQLKKEQPGYILNSLLVPFLNSAQALLAKGVADPETIDKTWMLATGAPLGPFRILDVVGLTTAYNIVVMNPEAKDPETLPGKIAALLKSYIDAGKTGINAGEGFYKY